MSRAADYTIKGFLYQFNKTLLELLNSQEGSIISVEGIVEDVEVVTSGVMDAIQCKYHEASESFTESKIYKPLLQMMCHFVGDQNSNIRYILFSHFPGVTGDDKPAVGKVEFQAAINSTNRDYKKYTDTLRGKIDLDEFLKIFTMDFGPTYDVLVSRVCAELEANGIPKGDIDTLAYPNAINMIANLSVKHDPAERTIKKEAFLEKLKVIRKTAISRWTMALHTQQILLKARRQQLKEHLSKNTRLRYFVVDPERLDDYQDRIVLFIKDFLEKYHFKPAHINTPVFCLCNSVDDFRDIHYRLFQKSIKCTDGTVASHFDETYFFRDPICRKGTGGAIEREFSLRLLRWEEHSKTLNNRKCDDLFIIGEPDCGSLNTVDVNIECLAASSLREISYLLGVSNAYE